MEAIKDREIGGMTQAEYVKYWEPLIETYLADADMRAIIESPYQPKLHNDYQVAVTVQVLDNIVRLYNRPIFTPKTPTSQNTLAEAMKRAKDLAKEADFPEGEALVAEAATATQTAAWSGATMIPIVLGMNRKIMPRILGLELVNVQPIGVPNGRIFFLRRLRHNNGTNDSDVENRGGWSYRSWIDDPGEATSIVKSTTVTFTSADVTPVARKLRTDTSIEFEQDIRAYFGIDGQSLLSDAAADEFAIEINEHILYRLWHAASGTSGGGVAYVGAKPSGYTVEEWERKIIEAIQRVSTTIRSRRRVTPNWLVFGSEPEVRISQLQVFKSGADMGTENMGNLGFSEIGSVMGRWRAYQMDLPFPTSDILVGYRGESWVDAGFFWLPYVPLMPYAIHSNPDTMVRTTSWLRRDAEYMVNAGYYGKVKIDEVNYTGTSYPAFAEFTS